MKTAMRGTSLDAYRSLPVSRMKTQGDRIVDVVRAAGRDMSLREIARAYERAYGLPLDVSTASARVHALCAANRLERLEATRHCQCSGRSVHPVRIPQKGARE
jgi:hypothetical protein